MSTPRLSIIYDRRSNDRGTIEIKVYFPEERKQIYISTGQFIEEAFFDTDLNLVKPNAPGYQQIKESIKKIHHSIQDTISTLQNGNNNAVTVTGFREAFKGKKAARRKNVPKDFTAFCQREIKNGNELSQGTKISYSATVKLLIQYKGNIPFNALNYGFAVGFDRFLREKYTNLNTIKKNILILKKFVTMASRLSLVTFENLNSFSGFKPSGQAVNKEFLLPEEIKQVEALKLEKDTPLYEVREMFLLAYFTALRISDIFSLKKQHFVMEGGDLYIKKVMHKLRKYNREIKINISKVFGGKGEQIATPYVINGKEFLFTQYGTAVANSHLKKIIEMAGIKKNASFHTARHSSLTTMASLTKDVFRVMVHGGISNIQTAQGYIHLSELVFGDGLDDIDWG